MKMPQSKRGSQVLPTKCQVWLTKSAPQTRAPKTWFRIHRLLAAFSEPHIEPQIRRLYGHRAIRKIPPRRTLVLSGRPPGCLLDVHIAAIFNLLRLLGDPPFVSVYTESTFELAMAVDQQARHLLSFARPEDSNPCIPRSSGFLCDP
jgi:hypothetical protein